MSPSSAALSSIGKTVQLAAEVRDQNGRAMSGAAVEWASSDDAVATVDASGLATAASNGSATITATSGAASGSATVTVEQSAATVVVSPDSAALLVGDTVRLSATVLDALGAEVEGAEVSWSSGDTLVATVDAGGLVTGIGAGKVEITAASAGVEGRTRLVVAVAAPTTVAVIPDSVSLTALGDTVRLAAEVFDQVGRSMPAAVAWSSGDSAVASVDSAGLVRAEGSGATKVTASSGSASGSASVLVMQSASTVAVTPVEATVGPGDTLRLAAEALDANGHPVSGAEFSWSSSDPAAATVDASGLVTGVAEGASTITAATGGAEGTAEITVANPDRAALVALYEATDGPNWLRSDNWLTDAPLRDWYGVETDGTGRVVALNLASKWDDEKGEWIFQGLKGPIPSELGDLTSLEDGLWLSGNALTGPVPPELGNLTSLKILDLLGNNLSGSIPPELGDLANLTSLALDDNDLVGPIPPELGNLSKLMQLSLSRNQLSGPIPPWLGKLVNLWGLWVYSNDLSGPIPPELGNIPNLTQLNLGGNDLSGQIPPKLGELVNLEDLWVYSNDLSGSIPPELGNLANLWTLDLRDNDLSGPIPPELGELANMHTLRLADTGICVPGVVRFVRWIDGIESFDGSSYCNEMDTAVLESLYASAGGAVWSNSAGWLAGPALEEWYGVNTDAQGRVATLDLAGNGLAGELPSGLGLLTELTELRVGDNGGLTGRLPVLLTRIPLSVLHYAGTDVCSPADDSFRAWLAGIASHEGTGAQCAPLGEREVLAALYEATDGANWAVSDNWLTDAPLAEWYGVETNASGRIVSLDLAGNGLRGPIPPELGELANLTELYLHFNHLRGSIPPELGKLSNLTQLNLGGNDLSSSIPPELGGLAKLAGLYVHSNDLSGPIPPALGHLTKLTFLSLGWNNLSGAIPPELGRLTNLSSLYLDTNRLTGPIPPELSGLANLTNLSLSKNRLAGPIPPELGGLANLLRLILGSNDLSGSLPSELGRLAYLRELDLTNNAAISGPLPSNLTDLRHLNGLYARGTGLCAASGDVDLQAWLAGVREVHLADCAPAAAYLVQAVQSRAFPVPLVAGEDALLRVFVTAARESDEGMPPVRVRFHIDGTETHAVDIAGSSVPIPTEIDEGNLRKSANAVIPGDVIRPGLEMVIEVDPDGTLDPALGVTGRFPETGRLPVEVREVPPFNLTVVPFLWASDPDSSVVGIADEMAADPEGHGLLAATRTLLPVADITARAHAPVTSSSQSAFDVIRETEAIRTLEGAGGHHLGLMARFSDIGGAARGAWVSVSVPHGDVIAHEFGHNMNLGHAPCGAVPGPDPRYPHPSGSIGAWGYDFPGEHDVRRGGGPVNPRMGDLMSYCAPYWIGDYHFAKALDFRLTYEGATARPSARSILVWGGVDGAGAPFLDPAFVVDARPTLPDSIGEHTVVGRAADGAELFSLGFAMPETADADGASAFVFVVPAEAGWASTLASVTLTGPGGEATLDRDTDRPMAILRDQRTAQVRGFLRGLSPAFAASGDLAAALSSEPGLEVLFSRGIPDATAWRR